jgi:hypothetical protein
MVQVIPGDSPVKEVINSGNSVTVPTGEVWQVNLATANAYNNGSDQDFTVTVGGADVLAQSRWGSGERQSWDYEDVVLKEGTTVSFSSSGPPAVFVSGFDVSQTVDNTPVTETLNGGSFSVPSDETWYVSIFGSTSYSGSGDQSWNAEINGNDFIGASDWSNGEPLNYHVDGVVLEGNDTINHVRSGSNGLLVSGWKI